MMRSLFSGITGLQNHQTRMDVIGNNIANVNTAGFKASRVVFQDMFSQTLQGGSANGIPLDINMGGVNPMQIGLGMRLSTIDVVHTRGAFMNTGIMTDLMIDGEGFFVVENPEGGNLFTRAGDFRIDNDGFLVTSQGLFVLGFTYPMYAEWDADFDPDVDVLLDNQQFVPPGWIITIGPEDPTDPADPGHRSLSLERIRVRIPNSDWPDPPPDPWDPDVDGRPYFDLMNVAFQRNGGITVTVGGVPNTIAVMALGIFSNAPGLERVGNSLYRESPASGAANITTPLREGTGPVVSGGLEMSNVDLATEFTDMIVTQRGFQANSRIITVSDSMLEELVNLKR